MTTAEAVQLPQRALARRFFRIIAAAVKAALLLLGLLWLISWLWGKLLWLPASAEVIKQLPSPDASATAFLVRHNPGAMSSFIYTVRLSPSGVEPGGGRVIIRGAGLEGLNFQWAGPRTLRLHVPCGQFSDATNYFGDATRNLWINVRWEFERPDCYYSQPLGTVE